jgi:hypothetical protein
MFSDGTNVLLSDTILVAGFDTTKFNTLFLLSTTETEILDAKIPLSVW